MSDVWDEIEAEHEPVTVAVTVCTDNATLRKIERLEDELREVREQDERENRTPEAPKVAEKILQLRESAKKKEREFVFAAIGRKAWSDLLAKWPATDDQRKRGSEVAWDIDEFPPRAMAASCVTPEGATVEVFKRIYDKWSLGEMTRLWSACLTANAGVNEVPKAELASALLAASKPS